MPKALDLSGQRFGMLVVLNSEGRINGCLAWRCQCDCGNSTLVPSRRLNSGHTRSCGCYQRTSKFKHGHGQKENRSSEYHSWSNMISRTTNPRATNYEYYGGRGINVCDRWLESFDNFLSDMGRKPPGSSLDRIDNSKGYSPENCRWADRKTQQSNMRNSRLYSLNGETCCINEWARRYKIPSRTLYARVTQLGFTLEEAVAIPRNAWATRRARLEQHGAKPKEGK